ncbi:MAG TPA: hypothetical protein DCX14_07195 [Flavobacteriales bacterium]|nr:hypothetical protein [Salibacteraceae bacterium]HAW19950.1 hypothetical protein [Flavobacteriales bacterium]
MIQRLIIWYVLFSGAFLGFKVVEQKAWVPSFFHSYFEDLIAVPIVLFSALLFIRLVLPDQQHYAISKKQILIITTIFVVHFELLMPALSHRFVSDPLDIIAYAIGSTAFWLIQKGTKSGMFAQNLQNP